MSQASLKAFFDTKAVDNFEIMPIHCACVNPSCGKTILEMMLAQLGPAAEDQCKDSEQRTLMHYAAVCESEEPLELLLATGFSPHRASINGFTPLMCACLANRPKNVLRLLAAKADPLARAGERTSFHLAVRNGWNSANNRVLIGGRLKFGNFLSERCTSLFMSLAKKCLPGTIWFGNLNKLESLQAMGDQEFSQRHFPYQRIEWQILGFMVFECF